ncbi:MAG TPA: hypothetical protein VFF74_08375 [Methylophilaceae bacterium]|nr:hypothetical protein [Methylophilaceae bacterium]
MKLSKKISMSIVLLALMGIAATPVFAEPAAAKTTAKGKSYTEDEFLRAFSGKSRKVVSEFLGNPVKKEQGVKPSSAAGVVGQMGKPMDTSKPVNVEMWYYNNLVNYEPKKTYKITELTFVNDRCMNIAFFNNK